MSEWEARLERELSTLNVVIENADTLLKRLNTRIRRWEAAQETEEAAEVAPQAPQRTRRGVIPMGR